MIGTQQASAVLVVAAERAYRIAVDHSQESEDQLAFLLAYNTARRTARQGGDTDTVRQFIEADETAAAAGWIEGLAAERAIQNITRGKQ
ncbi:hypothetical protein [Streptomyces sp. NPDC088674]|uniref:hypothetical protein n=1 Tax=Streptomyces sp. NPDC088674 TaxID=3365869 RepID=UPI003817FA1A